MGYFAPVGLAELVAGLRSGKHDLYDHINETCDRVDAVEPTIHALLPEAGRRERLLSEARALRSAFPDPASRPPLFGALLGVKDLFSADGFETRAGSRLPPGLFAMKEAPTVTALKRAGCLVLGKTVSTEFAYFSPGPTRNPLDTGRTPGGSSSGSAAAVAAGFCSLALGTQTIGSISRPAAFCGVTGYKPSYGRSSSEGVVPFSPSLDHVGLFTREPEDMALAAPAIVSPWRIVVSPDASGFPVLAIPEGPYLEQAEASALEVFRDTVEALRHAGFRVLSIDAFPDIARINERHRRIAARELARVHASWFAAYGDLYSDTTADLIRTGQAVTDEQASLDLSGRASLRSGLEASLRRAGAEFWISPSAPGPAPLGLAATGSPIMNLPWTHAGVPTLSLPSGSSADGMPLALQVAADFGRDEELLALGSFLSRLNIL